MFSRVGVRGVSGVLFSACALGGVVLAGGVSHAGDVGMILYTAPDGARTALEQPVPGHCYNLVGNGTASNLNAAGTTAFFYAHRNCRGHAIAVAPGEAQQLRFASVSTAVD
ncbi:hypothetical protein ACWD6P_12300 [Streptomyces sp. NPDC002446]